MGLPGESDTQVLQTINYLNRISPFGIKLQLLHVLADTDLDEDYVAGKFEVLTLDAYLNLVISCLAHLSPEIVLHRVTGDGPKDLLIAPKWSLDKRGVLNALHHRMKNRASVRVTCIKYKIVIQDCIRKAVMTLCYKIRLPYINSLCSIC